MTCSCFGTKLKECSCKLYGYPLKRNTGFPTPFVIQHLGQIQRTEHQNDPCCSHQIEDKGTLYKVFEVIYNKCAAYNLRYCPLRKAVDQDRYLINAVKDLLILTCFLVANLIVLVNILTRTAFHIFTIFKATGYGIKKYIKNSDSNMSVNFANVGTLARHDFNPPKYR